MNRWENHWIYWFAPLAGGALAGVLRKYVFDPDRRKSKNVDCISGSAENDGSSVDSAEEADCREEDNDDIESRTTAGHPASGLGDMTLTTSFSPMNDSTAGSTGRVVGQGGGISHAHRRSARGAASVFSAPAYDRHRRKSQLGGKTADGQEEEIYNGSRSLYNVRPSVPLATSSAVGNKGAMTMLPRTESVWCRLPDSIDLAADFGGGPKKPQINRSRSIYVPRSPEGRSGLPGNPLSTQLSKSQILLSPLGGDTGNLLLSHCHLGQTRNQQFVHHHHHRPQHMMHAQHRPLPPYRQGPLPPPPPPPPAPQERGEEHSSHEQNEDPGKGTPFRGSDVSVQNKANESYASSNKPPSSGYEEDEDEVYRAKREAQARAAASDLYARKEETYVARSESGYGTLGSGGGAQRPPQSQDDQIVPPPAFFSSNGQQPRTPNGEAGNYDLYSSPSRRLGPATPVRHHPQHPQYVALPNGQAMRPCGALLGQSPPSGFSTPRSMFSPVSHCSGISEL